MKNKNSDASYKKLIVYQKSKVLAIDLIKFFSKKRLSNVLTFIVNQLLRATTSIGANIAEGYGRYYQGNTYQFLSIARGSSYEADYWLEIVLEARILGEEETLGFRERNIEISKMLTGLMKKTSR